MEAAGIEPASVTGTPPASTCVVTCYLTRKEARSRAAYRASLTKISPRGQRPALGLGTEYVAPLGPVRCPPDPGTGCLIKQPVRSWIRHLLVFPPIYEMGGISACSQRSPDHVEARSPPDCFPSDKITHAG